jgi:hypothetical protein
MPPSGDVVLDEAGSWRRIMGAFLIACVVAIVIAIGASFVLDTFVQETSAAAFAQPGVRT